MLLGNSSPLLILYPQIVFYSDVRDACHCVTGLFRNLPPKTECLEEVPPLVRVLATGAA